MQILKTIEEIEHHKLILEYAYKIESYMFNNKILREWHKIKKDCLNGSGWDKSENAIPLEENEMNLIEEILQRCHSDLEGDVCRNYNREDIWEAMDEYAEEMCKKQREIDKQKLLKQLMPMYYQNGYIVEAVSKSIILSLSQLAPLATEEK